MIEKIMSKLGMVVLWCILIIYGIGVITHNLLGYYRCCRTCHFGCCLDCFCTLCPKIQNMVQEASQDA